MSSQTKWQNQAPAPESSKRPCILYIEENEAYFRRIKASLENAGYGVVGVTNSWQALALLLKSPIRLVLGGELLCGGDGSELAQRIKEIKPDVPVVLCSRTLPNSMRGIDAFVSAEESPSNLLTLISDFLDRFAA
jgi:DNA-binding NtrC family response regulator